MAFTYESKEPIIISREELLGELQPKISGLSGNQELGLLGIDDLGSGQRIKVVTGIVSYLKELYDANQLSYYARIKHDHFLFLTHRDDLAHCIKDAVQDEIFPKSVESIEQKCVTVHIGRLSFKPPQTDVAGLLERLARVTTDAIEEQFRSKKEEWP